MSKKKYIASFAPIIKGKSATYNFVEKKFKTFEKYAQQCLTQASIPVTVRDGKRDYEHVSKIHNWLRFDLDVKGEIETVRSVLDSQGLEYLCLPSTNYDPKNKNYKWHVTVRAENVAQDTSQYTWQCKQAMIDLGIDIKDTRVTTVCVQNMNAYRNGLQVKEGSQYMVVKKGRAFKFKNPPDDIHATIMSKTIYNGKGSNEVIPKKVVSATETFQMLSPESGIKIQDIGWVQLKDLNLHVGMMMSGLSCPAHNTRHDNGRGGHTCGYAFATMDEGGDTWINCSGTECKGKYYKVAYNDYGANTKLSDLFELRRIISLSAYNYKDKYILNIRDNGSSVMFRWSEVLDFWSKELFWKISLDLTEDNSKKISKINKKKKKHSGNIGLILDLDVKIKEIELENEYELIEDAMSNEKAFDYFKNKYTPTATQRPHELYIEDVMDTIGKYLKTDKQHNVVTYKIDPFIIDTTGEVKNNEFVVTTNKILPKLLKGVPNARILADYKEHNPHLEDILGMIMAQRYGADKKSSYLWIKASSNWGKSFLFEGMLNGIGYPMTESETKSAIKGLPSGLDIDKIISSSFLVFDEFKGAVSELKIIVNSMPVTAKHKSKTIIPVFLKIFLSAEEVQSLSGNIGMEEQFANRFLYIEMVGSLLDRELYTRDMDEYKKNVQLYINQYLWKLKAMYDGRGRATASKLANEIYSEYIDRFSIRDKTEKVTVVLPRMFRDWITLVRAREGLLVGSIYKDCLYISKQNVHIINIGKAKEVFINESLDKASSQMAYHKSPMDIFGETKRSKVRINAKDINTYIIEGA